MLSKYSVLTKINGFQITIIDKCLFIYLSIYLFYLFSLFQVFIFCFVLSICDKIEYFMSKVSMNSIQFPVEYHYPFSYKPGINMKIWKDISAARESRETPQIVFIYY